MSPGGRSRESRYTETGRNLPPPAGRGGCTLGNSLRSGLRTHLRALGSFVAAGSLCVLLSACGGPASNDFSEVRPSEPSSSLSPKPAKSEFRPSATNAKEATKQFTSVATPGEQGYKIGPQDVLEFSVFKVPELGKTVQVADTGTINLPLVGEVRAAGLTATQLERDLEKQLGAKYLQKPQVTVLVKEFNSQRITIEGSVKKPGVYPVRGKATLLQYVAMAEGLDPLADSTIVVFREVDGKRAAARFDINDIRSGATKDPVLTAGDIVVVSNSMIKESLNNVLKFLPLMTVFALL